MGSAAPSPSRLLQRWKRKEAKLTYLYPTFRSKQSSDAHSVVPPPAARKLLLQIFLRKKKEYSCAEYCKSSGGPCSERTLLFMDDILQVRWKEKGRYVRFSPMTQ